ncbi:MAG: response regulator [Candidatus Melainabacteria bacterium]|nr:response regulator [Candidatus Melainabacteria bacterium]
MSFCVLKIVAKAERDLVVVRYRARQIAGFVFDCPANRARIVTAVSEVTRNAIDYAGQGNVKFFLDNDGQRQFLEIVVEDNGPGIADVDAILHPPERKACRGGLASIVPLMDDIAIDSRPGEGTTVRLKKFIECNSTWVCQTNITEWKRRLIDESPFSVVDDLEQQNKQLIDTLDQLGKVKASLEEKTQQLHQANKYKGEFLANMSHEIRTPMNAVIGMSNILDRTELDDDQKKYVRLIKEAGKSLLDIINDILDFSKIEAGKIELEKIDIDVCDLVESTAELLATQAQDKSLSLVSWVDPELPGKVVGDPVRIRQILINLTNNAIKFTTEGEVIVRARVKDDGGADGIIRFEVIDTGIGLSESQRAKLFKPFVQADGSTTRKYGGTGLGLSICKQLAELMGGRIGVDSVENRGSTFWFEIPFEVVEPGRSPESRERLFATALVVEDHSFTRKVLQEYLESFGIKCDTAESAEDALEIIASHPDRKYELFLLDYMMAEMDGLELTREIRKLPRFKDSSIVFLTAFNDADLGKRAVAAGSNAFLTKPVRHSQLHDCLARLASGDTLDTFTVQTPPRAGAPAQARVEEREDKTERFAVLLAEDNPTNQMVASIELEGLGVDVQIAQDGQEAVDLVSQYRYDLIFMDCQMPGMDGYQATREIRRIEQKEGRKRLPIVAMTANALPGDREKCINAGMDDYITKPFDPAELAEIVRKWSPDAKAEPKAVPGNDSPALDREQLMSRFGPEKSAKLVEVFITDTSKRMHNLKTFVDTLDFDNLARQAHAIKGASSMIYATSLSERARDLEAAAREKDEDRLRLVFASMQEEFDRLETVVASG